MPDTVSVTAVPPEVPKMYVCRPLLPNGPLMARLATLLGTLLPVKIV